LKAVRIHRITFTTRSLPEKGLLSLNARTIMDTLRRINEKEKELLTVLGRHSQLSLKALLSHTGYKRRSSIVRKLEQFREQKILWGPVYLIDYGKLCRNPLHGLFCIIELGKSYETVIEYLKLIESLIWVYPVLSSHKEVLNVLFLSSNNQEVEALLKLLKDNNIITHYIIRVRSTQLFMENPNFFREPIPSLDTLLNPCEFPDISFGHHDTEWSECDIRTLSYLHGGYKSIKLIEILKKERKAHRTWTYEQIKYSHRKMSEHKLIKKIYYIAPFTQDQCANFFLFLKTEDEASTQKILCNFAKDSRIFREYALCDDWGMIGCICHPLFLTDLMHKLDLIDEIKKKELYHVRSIPPGIRYVGEHSEFEYYDVDTQMLEYPYHVFREQIKEKLELSSE
jgi:hypothetical protein